MRLCSFVLVIALVFILVGCDLSTQPQGSADQKLDAELMQLLAKPFKMSGDIVPDPLVEVEFGDEALTFWPFSADDFSGMAKDPINLIFVGNADPLDIRAALLALDGDRSDLGMDPVPPFNDVWDDETAGDIQASYGQPDGWSGGCIQLTCGDFGPLRFHMRLFKMGDWTVANAHFEMQIPGTSDHQVLSWEVAEQFVIGDMMRTGLLDTSMAMMPTQQINPLSWRTIPAIIYNELPVELRGLIGGPLEDVTEDVELLSDGQAMILNLAGQAPRVPETRTKNFIIEYGIIAPKPFCNSGEDYVMIVGPVQMSQSTTLSEGGNFHGTFRAEGELMVTPVNPMNGEPIGETLTAEIFQNHDTQYSRRTWWVSGLISQHLLPDEAEGAGRLFVNFQVRSRGNSGFMALIRCNDGGWSAVDPDNRPTALSY